MSKLKNEQLSLKEIETMDENLEMAIKLTEEEMAEIQGGLSAANLSCIFPNGIPADAY